MGGTAPESGQYLVMTRRPSNVAWVGFSPEQTELLDFLDHLGNNGWSRNSQTEEVMPKLLAQCEVADLPLDRIKDAMASVGYGREALHQLDRWESKRTPGGSAAERYGSRDSPLSSLLPAPKP